MSEPSGELNDQGGGELSDQVAILGAIDQKVVADPTVMGKVAPLLCPYRDEARGWFEPFHTWVRDQTRKPLPDLENAVASLGNRRGVRRHHRARRLLLAAALSRAFPDKYGPGAEQAQHVVDALKVATPGADAERAKRLHALITDDRNLPHVSRWHGFLDQAHTLDLITPETHQPAPCQGDVVEAPIDGRDRPATALRSGFVATDLPFERAKLFLEPQRWKGCLDFWCEMARLDDAPQGVDRYLETVSLDCQGGGLKIQTCLDFRRKDYGEHLSVVSYRLTDDQTAHGGDGAIVVDEGSLMVRQVEGGVHVSTTKRVLFDQQRLPVNPYQLAMVCCALGYGAMGEQFVYNCAHAGRPADATTSSGSGGSRPAEYARYVEEVAAEVESCLTDWNEMYRSAYSKAMSGTYTADDFSKGVARVYKRMARETYRTIQLGMEGLRVAGGDAPAPAASPPPSPATNSDIPDDGTS